MRTLAIIPARSGSKGIKDKNIKLLSGKPLMAYSIEAALKSKCFDIVMVSTDSKEYADIAQQCGADVPFLRSNENAGDFSSSWDVVLEVLDKYKEAGEFFSHVCLLQPTSPLRDELDIMCAFKKMRESQAKAIVSVCETEHSPLICNMLKKNEDMTDFIPRFSNKRRQDVETYYRINGSIYLVEIDFLLEDTFLYRKGCIGYIMDQKHSIDIDTEVDFAIAQTLMTHS